MFHQIVYAHDPRFARIVCRIDGRAEQVQHAELWIRFVTDRTDDAVTHADDLRILTIQNLACFVTQMTLLLPRALMPHPLHLLLGGPFVLAIVGGHPRPLKAGRHPFNLLGSMPNGACTIRFWI